MSMALSSLELSHEEGFKKGIKKGEKIGIEIGTQVGDLQERLEVAAQMLLDGLEDDVVRKYTKLSEEQFSKLKKVCHDSKYSANC